MRDDLPAPNADSFLPPVVDDVDENYGSISPAALANAAPWQSSTRSTPPQAEPREASGIYAGFAEANVRSDVPASPSSPPPVAAAGPAAAAGGGPAPGPKPFKLPPGAFAMMGGGPPPSARFKSVAFFANKRLLPHAPPLFF